MKYFSIRYVLVWVCALAIWGGLGLANPLYVYAKPADGASKSAKAGKNAKTARQSRRPPGRSARKPARKANARSGKAGRAGSGKTGAELRARRSELENIGHRLENLQRDVKKTEAQKTEAAQAVAQGEREVSKATRALRQTISERTEASRQLDELETTQRGIEERITDRQNELAEWLRRSYIYGAASDVASLLAARDPNQIVRDAYYLEYLGRARLDLIEGLRADLRLKAEHAERVTRRRETLSRLEDDRRKRQEKLEETYANRREALGKIETTLKTQRERMAALKADEERLAQVVNTLARRATARAAAAKREAAARRERNRARARQNNVASRGAGRSPAISNKIAPEPVIGTVQEVPAATPGGANFSQLRGKLKFPVAGELIGRFGAPRAGQGTTWRGVFIRAANGTNVRAVSDGAVVYSDWLRGYGNLLILDHGSGYLSIYGNNDALYKETGDTVRAGEAIASVGASGSEPESGLYFEIRHRGQAIDPMQWVRLR